MRSITGCMCAALRIRKSKYIRLPQSMQWSQSAGYIIQPLDANSEKYPDSQVVDFYGKEFAIIPVNK